ncbi:UNVERIFIED_CONTAM: hypothetical protein FKN15_071750 [Acipenser sinensis]
MHTGAGHIETHPPPLCAAHMVSTATSPLSPKVPVLIPAQKQGQQWSTEEAMVGRPPPTPIAVVAMLTTQRPAPPAKVIPAAEQLLASSSLFRGSSNSISGSESAAGEGGLLTSSPLLKTSSSLADSGKAVSLPTGS